MVERIHACPGNAPACTYSMPMEVEEVAIIQDLVLCTCWPCYGELTGDETADGQGEIHVYDLLTQTWRHDFDIFGRSCSFRRVSHEMFSFRVHRLHVRENESSIGIFFNSDTLSIQDLTDKRQFLLTHIIDLSTMWLTIEECVYVYSIFFHPKNLSIYLYGDIHGTYCIQEVTFESVIESEERPYCKMEIENVRNLKLWEPVDYTAHVTDIFRLDDVVYAIMMGNDKQTLVTFDLRTEAITGVDELVEIEEDPFAGRPFRYDQLFNASWVDEKRTLRAQLAIVDPKDVELVRRRDKPGFINMRGEVVGDEDNDFELEVLPIRHYWWAIRVDAVNKMLRWERIVNPYEASAVTAATTDRALVTSEGDLYFLQSCRPTWYRIPWRKNLIAGGHIDVPSLEHIVHQFLSKHVMAAVRVAMSTHVTSRQSFAEVLLRTKRNYGGEWIVEERMRYDEDILKTDTDRPMERRASIESVEAVQSSICD